MSFELYSTVTRLAVIFFFLLYSFFYFLEVLLLIFLQSTDVMPKRFIGRPLTQRLVEDKVKQLLFMFFVHFKHVGVNLLKLKSRLS